MCEEFSSHLRSLMLIKTMKDARPLTAVTNSEYEQMEKQALTVPLPVILHGLDTMQDTLERMYRGVDRRTEMEMAFLKLCCPELDDSKAALLRRIEALEKRDRQAYPDKQHRFHSRSRRYRQHLFRSNRFRYPPRRTHWKHPLSRRNPLYLPQSPRKRQHRQNPWWNWGKCTAARGMAGNCADTETVFPHDCRCFSWYESICQRRLCANRFQQ